MTRAIITVKDFRREQFGIVVEGCKSKASAEALAAFVQQHIDGEVLGYAFIDEEILSKETPSEGGAYDTVYQQLQVSFVDSGGIPITLLIPSPAESIVQADQEADPDFVARLKAALLEHTQTTFLQFRKSGLVSFPG